MLHVVCGGIGALVGAACHWLRIQPLVLTLGVGAVLAGGSMFLVNGVMLQGEIVAFDLFCMLLQRDGLSQLVYKHAVSTVQPEHPVSLIESDEEESGA